MRKFSKRGATLIETVVLISLTSLTLTMMSMLTHALLKSSHELSQLGQVRRTVARLQDQLRQDTAHSNFRLARPENGVVTWQFTIREGKRIEYRAVDRTIARHLVTSTGQVEQREVYRLPPTFRFTLPSKPTDNSPQQIQIEHEQPGSKNENLKLEPTGLRIVMHSPKQVTESKGEKP